MIGDVAVRVAGHALAFQNAGQHYRDALEIGEPPPRERAALLIELAESDWCSGTPGAAEIHCWKAIELAKREGVVELWADAAVKMARWQLHSSGQVAERRVATLEESLVELDPADVDRRVRVIQALVWDLHWSDRRDRARELAFEGARLAEGSGDPRLELLSVSVANHVWCRPEDIGRRDRAVQRELELARRLDDPEMEFLAEGHEFGRALEHGDADAAARALAAQEALGEQLRQPRFDSSVLSPKTNQAMWEGRLDDAERLRAENEALSARRSDDLAILIRAAQLVALRRFQGRLPELAPLYEAGRARFPLVSGFVAGVGLIALSQGESERALAECAPLWQGDRLSIVHDILYPVSLAAVAEIVTTAGTEAQNRSVLEALVPYSGRMLVVNSVMTAGCASRLMGRAAVRVGDLSEADHHFAVSLETEQRLRARPWEMLTRLDRARMLDRLGRVQEADDERRTADRISRETGVPLTIADWTGG